MKNQKKMFKTKEQEKSPETNPNKTELHNLQRLAENSYQPS